MHTTNMPDVMFIRYDGLCVDITETTYTITRIVHESKHEFICLSVVHNQKLGTTYRVPMDAEGTIFCVDHMMDTLVITMSNKRETLKWEFVLPVIGNGYSFELCVNQEIMKCHRNFHTYTSPHSITKHDDNTTMIHAKTVTELYTTLSTEMIQRMIECTQENNVKLFKKWFKQHKRVCKLLE